MKINLQKASSHFNIVNILSYNDEENTKRRHDFIRLHKDGEYSEFMLNAAVKIDEEISLVYHYTKTNRIETRLLQWSLYEY